MQGVFANPGEGWQKRALGDVCSLITDGKHGDCENEANSGYYFLSAKDVKYDTLNYENARQITKAGFEETHRRTNLKPGDICMVNTGATIGRISIAPDNPKTYKTTFQKSVAVIKTIPKLYFNDPGLAAYLLGIKKPDELVNHYSRGALFENMIVVEAVKAYYNKGEDPSIFFWRDSLGLEVDLIIEKDSKIYPVEIKSGKTFDNDFIKNILKFNAVSRQENPSGTVVYGGNTKQSRDYISVFPWNQWCSHLQNSIFDIKSRHL